MRFNVGFASAIIVAACGGSSPTSYGGANPPPPPPPPPPPGPTASVSMTDNAGLTPYAFSPANLSVKVGTTVIWTNNGKASHTSTSDATPAVWASGTVAPAGSTSCAPNDPYCTPGTTPPGTFNQTFTTAGTYQYHCAFHQAQGMTGTITVTP
jgi:plastocyanin